MTAPATALATAPTPVTDALEALSRRVSAVEGALGVLSWDRMVMMPAGGGDARAEQAATLGVIAHELLTNPKVADLLAAAGEEPLDGWRAANLDELRRRHAHATAVPSSLVEASSRAAAKSETAWRTARATSDFALAAGPLAEVVRLTQETAAAKAAALGLEPYAALLDQYEPGGSVSRIEGLFAELEAALPPILDAVLSGRPATGRRSSRQGRSRWSSSAPWRERSWQPWASTSSTAGWTRPCTRSAVAYPTTCG